MSGVQSARRERWDDVGIVKLTHEAKTTHVMFTRTQGDRFVSIPATAPTAILADLYGTQQTLTAENGFFGVNLPAANCTQIAGDYCMIGGHTCFIQNDGLVQFDGAPHFLGAKSLPRPDCSGMPNAAGVPVVGKVDDVVLFVQRRNLNYSRFRNFFSKI